jgi:hypothetical protein
MKFELGFGVQRVRVPVETAAFAWSTLLTAVAGWKEEGVMITEFALSLTLSSFRFQKNNRTDSQNRACLRSPIADSV